MVNELTIGRLAQAAEVNVETVRYYQRRGLLEEPARPLNGIRRYPDRAVSRLRFIKRAQELGFTLDEVASLLKLEDGRSCRQTRSLAQKKLAAIEERLARLQRMRRLLRSLIAECETGRRPRSCPIISTLSRG
jgi:MerR family mercuric resistance operon transcriptional regulator